VLGDRFDAWNEVLASSPEAIQTFDELEERLGKHHDYERAELKWLLYRVCFAYQIFDLEALKRKALRSELRRDLESQVWKEFLGLSREAFRGCLTRLAAIANEIGTSEACDPRRLKRLAEQVEQVNGGLATSPAHWIPVLAKFLKPERQRVAEGEIRIYQLLPEALRRYAEGPSAGLPRVLRQYARYAKARELWVRDLLSLKDFKLAVFEEVFLFTYIEHLCGNHQFWRVGLILDSLWDGMMKRRLCGVAPFFDEDSLRQRYRRFWHRRQIEPPVPWSDEMKSVWLARLLLALPGTPLR
jgi:hypothetical protein